jgi:exosortase
VALLAYAYLPLFALEAGPIAEQIERFFFESTGTSGGLVLAVGGWLAWRRRSRLAAAQGRGSLGIGCLLWLCAFALYLWSTLVGAADLMLLSLGGLLLAVAALAGGSAGVRAMALPAAILLFALPIPSPLENEVVWQLQLASATGGHALLTLLGLDVTRAGALLRHEETFFLVIESCSGLRSIRTLTLVALVLRELFGTNRRRLWALVAGAPLLALALNVVRIAIIATDATQGEPEIGEQHVGQGLTVLAIGTALLFLAGHFLAGRAAEGASGGSDAPRGAFPWRGALAALAGPACIAAIVSPWAPASPTRPDLAGIPVRLGGWTGTDADTDRVFIGTVPVGNVVHRLFEMERGDNAIAVSLFIATEAPGTARGSPFSSKLRLPGRAYGEDRRADVRLYALGRDAVVSEASSEDSFAVAYTWTLHGDGFWRDTLRSLVALERGPFSRARERVIVRIATDSSGEDASFGRARRVLDRFVHDFRKPLASL